ncbi:MAG: tetratricopeptide repeat protein [Oligoflexia bacterium]|nr:tetratricopeptide repeat protein [Oligoflexia bacterium]
MRPGVPPAIEAARLGGTIAIYEVRNFEKAAFFFRHIVRYSRKPADARWAQERLAEIYYEKLNNYPQAILEFQRLLQSGESNEEADEYRLKLARSYYFMGNFEQAILEVNEFTRLHSNSSKLFEMLMVKADSMLALKNYDGALTLYAEIERTYPENLELYRVKLSKSLVYEEKEDWNNAVRELEDIRGQYPYPDVLELKIKSILRRKEKKRNG